jgi:hypothetical protein
MALWEYRVEMLGSNDDPSQTLNSLGEDRWELVSVTSTNNEVKAYFKRELVYGAGDQRPSKQISSSIGMGMEPVQASVTVPSDRDPREFGWVSTGIFLDNDTPGLSFSINGNIQESSGESVGPDGHPYRLVTNEAIGMELPSGCLVVKVGEDGDIEPVYNSGFLAVTDIGELFLTVNDDSYENNFGDFTVIVNVL